MFGLVHYQIFSLCCSSFQVNLLFDMEQAQMCFYFGLIWTRHSSLKRTVLFKQMVHHSLMSQHSTYSGHTGHSAADHRLVSRDERMRLFRERFKRKRQLLKWFNTPDGKKLRLWTGDHQCFKLDYGRCVLCNVNNANYRGGKKSRIFCGVCAVHLCTDSTSTRSSCMREWHGVRDLQQRVNVPRRAMLGLPQYRIENGSLLLEIFC